MQRLIDAYELERKAKFNQQVGNFIELSDLKKAPTIDAKPVVHAHWIHNTDDFTPKKRCSYCGYNKPVVAGENIEQEPDDYCNKCGAKMDEEQECGT